MKVAGFRRQISAGVAAQGYSQAVTVASQLLLVPAMLWAWGAELYGSWLIVSAIPSYLALMDLGLSQVAANDMTMRLAKGDSEGAIVVNQTAWLMNVATCTAIMVAAVVLVPTLIGLGALSIGNLSATEIGVAILALTASVVVGLTFGTVGAGMRSVGMFWLTVTTSATSRLLEACVLVLSAVLGAGIVEAAIAMLAARVVVYSGVSAWFLLKFDQFRPAIHRADRKLLKRMVGPSLGYMSLTVGNALSIQGVTILIGALLGPTAVVIVNAIRTLTRLGRMAASVIIYAVEPIFAQLAGRSEIARANSIHGTMIAAIGAGTVVYVVGMLLLGEPFLEWWTHGVVKNQTLLFWLMLAAVVFEIGWFSLQTPYVATNRHGLFSFWFAVSAAISLGALWLVTPFIGIDGAGVSTASLHGIMLVLTVLIIRQLRT